MQSVINIPLLAETVRARLKELNLSQSAVARQIGISPSSLTRFIKHGLGDGDIVFPLCRWLGVPFERFSLLTEQPTVIYRNAPAIDHIEQTILSDKNLAEQDKPKLAAIFRACYEKFQGATL